MFVFRMDSTRIQYLPSWVKAWFLPYFTNYFPHKVPPNYYSWFFLFFIIFFHWIKNLLTFIHTHTNTITINISFYFLSYVLLLYTSYSYSILKNIYEFHFLNSSQLFQTFSKFNFIPRQPGIHQKKGKIIIYKLFSELYLLFKHWNAY